MIQSKQKQDELIDKTNSILSMALEQANKSDERKLYPSPFTHVSSTGGCDLDTILERAYKTA